jgi:hypothetical protein
MKVRVNMMLQSHYVECVEKIRALFGDEHPDTLTIISILAALYESQDTSA